MERTTRLYIVPMIGIGFTKASIEVKGIYVELSFYQFLCFEYSICKHYNIN